MAASIGSTVTVNGVEGHRFRDTEPPIFLLTDGRFAMQFGGLWKVRSSINPLLLMVSRHDTTVGVVRLPRIYEPHIVERYVPEVIQAVSWERGVIGTRDGKRVKTGFGEYHTADTAVLKSMAVLFKRMDGLDLAHQKEMAKLVKEYDRLCAKLKPIRENGFQALVAEIDTIRPRRGKGKVEEDAEA